jgi:surface antigen
MTKLRSDDTRATRRGRFARVLAAGVLAAAGVMGIAGAANAATGSATAGTSITYNEGYQGSCVFYALDRFHQATGVYPEAFGDARYLASSAAQHGWATGSTPAVNSVVVFQPGDNGAAAPTGHAAWVEQVSGARIYIAEMNAPVAGAVTYRWVDAPAATVRYIYAS